MVPASQLIETRTVWQRMNNLKKQSDPSVKEHKQPVFNHLLVLGDCAALKKRHQSQSSPRVTNKTSQQGPENFHATLKATLCNVWKNKWLLRHFAEVAIKCSLAASELPALPGLAWPIAYGGWCLLMLAGSRWIRSMTLWLHSIGANVVPRFI